MTGHPILWQPTHLSDDETVAKMGHPALWFGLLGFGGLELES